MYPEFSEIKTKNINDKYYKKLKIFQKIYLWRKMYTPSRLLPPSIVPLFSVPVLHLICRILLPFAIGSFPF
jgi:hypothetical protein